MDVILESKLLDEYKKLKKDLETNIEVTTLVKQKNGLLNKLRELDQYSSKYNSLKNEYDLVSEKLFEFDDYARFKLIEREVNLFIMYCNSKLEELFGLNEKRCSH